MSAILVVTGLISCDEITIDDNALNSDAVSSRTIQFKLHVTRASSVSDFRSIFIIDVKDGKVQQTVCQKAGETQDFGSPTITLSGGEHLLHFFATDSDGSVLNGCIAGQNPIGDTFYKTVTVTSAADDETRSIVLERIVAKVIWQGDGTATFSSVPNELNLRTKEVTSAQTTVTLNSGDSFYTLIPSDGKLTLDNGKTIEVKSNRITIVKDKDGTTDEKPDDNEGSDDSYQIEIEVVTNDTAIIYTPIEGEVKPVTLQETPDPAITFAQDMHPYRIPTRLEAQLLRTVNLSDAYWNGGTYRCLCYDHPKDNVKKGGTQYGTGDYYTFLWGSGSVTKAGYKTEYCIKPIRTVPITPIYKPYIDADFSWSSDTITYINT